MFEFSGCLWWVIVGCWQGYYAQLRVEKHDFQLSGVLLARCIAVPMVAVFVQFSI